MSGIGGGGLGGGLGGGGLGGDGGGGGKGGVASAVESSAVCPTTARIPQDVESRVVTHQRRGPRWRRILLSGGLIS